MSQEKTKASKVCANCGGQLEIDATQETIECPYCGTDYSVSDLLNDSDAVKIEKIKSKTQKDIEMGKLEHEKEKSRIQEEKEKRLYTMEYNNGKLIQIRAVCNGEPDPEAKRFAEVFAEQFKEAEEKFKEKMAG